MFAKHLTSSSESLYMQMIHTNYINNNIPGSKRSALVHCPGFAELQTTPSTPPEPSFLANAKETGGNRTGEERRAAKRARDPTLQPADRARGRAGSSQESHEHLYIHPTSHRSPETPRPAPVRSGQVVMQQAGMARLEKSLSLCNAASALAPFQVPCSRARLIQPFYLSSHCLC